MVYTNNNSFLAPFFETTGFNLQFFNSRSNNIEICLAPNETYPTLHCKSPESKVFSYKDGLNFIENKCFNSTKIYIVASNEIVEFKSRHLCSNYITIEADILSNSPYVKMPAVPPKAFYNFINVDIILNYSTPIVLIESYYDTFPNLFGTGECYYFMRNYDVQDVNIYKPTKMAKVYNNFLGFYSTIDRNITIVNKYSIDRTLTLIQDETNLNIIFYENYFEIFAANNSMNRVTYALNEIESENNIGLRFYYPINVSIDTLEHPYRKYKLIIQELTGCLIINSVNNIDLKADTTIFNEDKLKLVRDLNLNTHLIILNHSDFDWLNSKIISNTLIRVKSSINQVKLGVSRLYALSSIILDPRLFVTIYDYVDMNHDYLFIHQINEKMIATVQIPYYVDNSNISIKTVKLMTAFTKEKIFDEDIIDLRDIKPFIIATVNLLMNYDNSYSFINSTTPGFTNENSIIKITHENMIMFQVIGYLQEFSYVPPRSKSPEPSASFKQSMSSIEINHSSIKQSILKTISPSMQTQTQTQTKILTSSPEPTNPIKVIVVEGDKKEDGIYVQDLKTESGNIILVGRSLENPDCLIIDNLVLRDGTNVQAVNLVLKDSLTISGESSLESYGNGMIDLKEDDTVTINLKSIETSLPSINFGLIGSNFQKAPKELIISMDLKEVKDKEIEKAFTMGKTLVIGKTLNCEKWINRTNVSILFGKSQYNFILECENANSYLIKDVLTRKLVLKAAKIVPSIESKKINLVVIFASAVAVIVVIIVILIIVTIIIKKKSKKSESISLDNQDNDTKFVAPQKIDNNKIFIVDNIHQKEYKQAKSKRELIYEMEKDYSSASISVSLEESVFDGRNLLSDYLMDFSNFKEIKVLGLGSFGTVYLMKNMEDNKEYAVKSIMVTSTDVEESFIREVDIMCSANHPCIVKIIGFSFANCSTNALIALEYHKNGTIEDIFKKIRNGKMIEHFTSTRKSIIVIGIAFGMRYLHDNGILHRDLKPANVFLDSRLRAHIGDFGISKFEELGITNTKSIGTPFYSAPELFNGSRYDSKADIYSFGMILFELAVGKPVFELNINQIYLYRKKIEGIYEKIPDDVLPLTSYLIESCLSLEPSNRPTFDDIIKLIKKNKFKLFKESDIITVDEYYRNLMNKESKL